MNMEFNKEKNILTLSGNGETLSFEFLNNKVLRIFKEKNDTSLIELSYKKFNKDVEVKNENGNIEFDFNNFHFVVKSLQNLDIFKDFELLTSIDLKVKFDEYEKRNYFSTNVKLENDIKVFGFGDKMAFLNKVGYYYRSHNTDDPNHQDELFPSLYKSINYCLFENNLKYLGFFFPSTYIYTYDVGKTDIHNFSINNFDENIDMFLILGEDVEEITKNYSSLVGHPYFVRLKMLGYSQSRWSYENEEMVREVARKFKENDLPIDYIHLDIHYMDGYRDFTIDKSRFPDMKKLSDELKEDDIELVAINDAAIKEDREFEIFKYLEDNNLFTTLDGKTYINAVWPGDSGFPNYVSEKTKEYFCEVAHNFIKTYGISGIWCDMNEPASFRGELPKNVEYKVGSKKYLHEKIHNIYAEHMVKSFVETFTKDNIRPYLFSRAAFATTSKYAFVWNGDNHSLWHHLRFSITQNLSLSLSNFMFNGVDVGGFGSDGNKQLLIRWVEADLFMPFLRNHSSLNTIHQEPYAFDEETTEIYRKYLRIRYDFVPYLYNLTYRMSNFGEMIVRPLFANYKNDKKCLTINDEYMVGEDLLVAPILTQDAIERSVYFPEGEWIDYLNGKKYKGNKSYVIEMNLGETGYFIRNNSIIPQFKGLNHIEKDKIDTLVLKVFGKKGKLSLYEDDGNTLNYQKGEYNIYDISFKNNSLSFKTKVNGYKSPFKKIIIEKDGISKEVPFKNEFIINL